MSRTGIDDLLERARGRLDRLSPDDAFAAVGAGAVLVDTRSAEERAEHGAIPGALRFPLSVVLWRLDPDVPSENEKLSLDTQVIVICRHGYSSSLAAAALQEIGFARATDVIGGAEAWRDAGLPIDPS
jgi:rhodanese-related sulfurtransferase